MIFIKNSFGMSPMRTVIGGLRKSSNLSELSGNALKVDFYYDTVSPYSWPAFEVLCRYRDRWNLEVTWKPVFMGGLMNSSGNPYLNTMMSCPNRSRYGFMDLARRTGPYFDIPFKMKEDPIKLIGVIGSLNQQRFITAVNEELPEMTESVSRNFGSDPGDKIKMFTLSKIYLL